MSTPASALLLAGLIFMTPVVADDTFEIDFLLFLAEFADDQGNWDAPPIEEEDTTEPVELNNE